jgi:hypothetical protein
MEVCEDSFVAMSFDNFAHKYRLVSCYEFATKFTFQMTHTLFYEGARLLFFQEVQKSLFL